MHRSSGKLPLGRASEFVPVGKDRTNHAPGLYDRCIRSFDSFRSTAPNFSGKFCSVFLKSEPDGQSATSREAKRLINPSTWMKTDWIVDLCIPSTCSAQDVGQAVAQSLGNVSVVAMTSDDRCYTLADESSTSLDAPAYYML